MTLQKLSESIRSSVIGRENEIEAILTALIAQEAVLLIGIPGVGKSMLLRSICGSIRDAKFFEYLLNKDTSTDELFGPIDMEALATEKKWRRDIRNSMLDSEFVFLDEFWNGSSYIRNSTLAAMNERVVRDYKDTHHVPLRMLCAASNMWPIGEGFSDAQASFDRFLFRLEVKPLPVSKWSELIQKEFPPVLECLTLEELDGIAKTASEIPFTPESHGALIGILEELQANGIRVGDRRIRKSAKAARASAMLSGAKEVGIENLECLKWVLWSDPTEQREKAEQIIMRISNPVAHKITEILSEIAEIIEKTGDDAAQRMASLKKLEEQEKHLKKLGVDGRAKSAVDFTKRQRAKIMAKQIGVPEEKAMSLIGD